MEGHQLASAVALQATSDEGCRPDHPMQRRPDLQSGVGFAPRRRMASRRG